VAIGYTLLSPAMFASACDAAVASGIAPVLHADAGRHCCTSLIMCQATLEAFLNERLAQVRAEDSEHPEPERGQWDDLFEALDGASIQQKYLVYPQLLFGKTFDKGAEPFQSFALLVHLRNAIVHYAPQAKETGWFPSGKIRGLSSRLPFTFAGSGVSPGAFLNTRTVHPRGGAVGAAAVALRSAVPATTRRRRDRNNAKAIPHQIDAPNSSPTAPALLGGPDFK